MRQMRQSPRRKTDPAPSKLRYRVVRLWRRKSFRSLILVWAPLAALAAGAAWGAMNDEVRARVDAAAAEARAALAVRPEFALTEVIVDGRRQLERKDILTALNLPPDLSSIEFDAAAARDRIKALGWVRSVRVSVEPPNAVHVSIVERQPAAVWRIDGDPVLIDAVGARIAAISARAQWPGLPLLVGPGADKAAPEALALLEASPYMAKKMRALVRVGERRWDVELEGDVVVKLPEKKPIRTLVAALMLQRSDQLLERDVSVLDLRNPGRPTVRLGARAIEKMRARRSLIHGKDA